MTTSSLWKKTVSCFLTIQTWNAIKSNKIHTLHKFNASINVPDVQLYCQMIYYHKPRQEYVIRYWLIKMEKRLRFNIFLCLWKFVRYENSLESSLDYFNWMKSRVGTVSSLLKSNTGKFPRCLVCVKSLCRNVSCYQNWPKKETLLT